MTKCDLINKVPSFADTHENMLPKIKFDMSNFDLVTASAHLSALRELLHTLQNSHIKTIRRIDGKDMDFEAKSQISDAIIIMKKDRDIDGPKYTLSLKNRAFNNNYALTLQVENETNHDPDDVALVMIPLIKKSLLERIALIRKKGIGAAMQANVAESGMVKKIIDRIVVEYDQCKPALKLMFGDFEYIKMTAPTLDEDFKVTFDKPGQYKDWPILSLEAYQKWAGRIPAQYEVMPIEINNLNIERKILSFESMCDTQASMNAVRRLAVYSELPELEGPTLHLDENGMPSLEKYSGEK